MLNNDKTKKIVISFALADLIFALVYGGLFFAVSQKNKETATAYSSIYRRASDKAALSLLEKTLASTEPQRALLDGYVITPAESLFFIEQIEDLGRTTSTNVKVVSLSSPKKTGDAFSLDFTGEGKFENVYRLFSLIEEMPFRISIKRTSMTANTKDMTWIATFTIVLGSYRM